VALRWSMPAKALVPSYRNLWRRWLYLWASWRSRGRQFLRHLNVKLIRLFTRQHRD